MNMVIFFTGVIVKQPFFDPLREEALYDDGELWEVSVTIVHLNRQNRGEELCKVSFYLLERIVPLHP